MTCCKNENALSSIENNGLLYDKKPIKAYKRRWLMLGLFLLFEIINSIQFPQYTVVANLMVSYYGVSELDIAWSTMIYMATYIIFSFPGLYILELLGIRKTLIIGMVGMSAGAWIKVISVKQTLYWFALTGQTIVAIFQIFVLPIPPKIAALWFPEKEVASACSLGVVGAQFGITLGYLFTPLLIRSGTAKVIEEGLYVTMMSTAIFSTVVGIAIFFWYEEHPPKPPSLTQLQAAESRIMVKSTFQETAKKLITNKSFVVFVIVFGVNLAIFVPYAVYITQITLHYYPNSTSSDVGLLAIILMSCLIIGALLSGITLDKYRRYRLLTYLALALTISTFFVFCLCYGSVLWLFKLSVSLFGFSIGCIFSIGYEVAVELTYPEPEAISGGFLSCSYQLFGIIFSYLYYLVFKSFGFTYANFAFVGTVLITDILIFFIAFDLKRQKIVNNVKYNEI